MFVDVSSLIVLTLLAALFGLVLLVLSALTITAASQSRRLRGVRRHLAQLSRVVQQLAQAIDELRQSQNDDLAPAPLDSPPERIGGEQIPDAVQPADSPVDPKEQLKVPQEVVIAEARHLTQYFENCRSCGQTINLRSLDEVLHHDKPGHRPLTDAELIALEDATAHRGGHH
jgi:hypothetical protein